MFFAGSSCYSSTRFMLAVDRKVVNDNIPTFISAICLMFGSYYCLNIHYPVDFAQHSSFFRGKNTHTQIILMSSTLFMKRLIVEFVLKQMLFQHQSRKGHKGGNKEEQEATVCEPKKQLSGFSDSRQALSWHMVSASSWKAELCGKEQHDLVTLSLQLVTFSGVIGDFWSVWHEASIILLLLLHL